MMTWQIMIGAQLISMTVSVGVVIAFMLKKEPLDAAEKNTVVKLVKNVAHAEV